MKRGMIVTVAGGGGYAGKPRAAPVIQADEFYDLPSLTVCLLTTLDEGGPETRVEIRPSDRNGLRERCFAMVDKITIVSNTKVGDTIGTTEVGVLRQVNTAIMLFLALEHRA
jgi:mRNA interferase MazF